MHSLKRTSPDRYGTILAVLRKPSYLAGPLRSQSRTLTKHNPKQPNNTLEIQSLIPTRVWHAIAPHEKARYSQASRETNQTPAKCAAEYGGHIYKQCSCFLRVIGDITSQIASGAAFLATSHSHWETKAYRSHCASNTLRSDLLL